MTVYPVTNAEECFTLAGRRAHGTQYRTLVAIGHDYELITDEVMFNGVIFEDDDVNLTLTLNRKPVSNARMSSLHADATLQLGDPR